MNSQRGRGKHLETQSRSRRLRIALVAIVGLSVVLVAGIVSSAWNLEEPSSSLRASKTQVSQVEKPLNSKSKESSSQSSASNASAVNSNGAKGNTSASQQGAAKKGAARQKATATTVVASDDKVVYEPGVVLIPVESGQTAADIDAKLANIDGVATKSVDDQDLSQGFVRVSTSDKTSVEGAVKQLKGVGLESQPNYAYSLADDDDKQQKGASKDLANALTEGPDAHMDSTGKSSSNDGAGPSAETNDPVPDNAFALSVTDVTSAWDLVKTNKHVSVAILDTGFRVSHEDLKDNIVATYDATVANPANGLAGEVKDVTDAQGHGTHVAGIVSAEANNSKGIAGVSYNAGIVGVKVFPSCDVRNAATSTNKRLPYCYTDDLAYGYKYVIANRNKYNIRVINMSIGGTRDEDGDDEDTLLYSKIKEAYEAGIVTVCAAGNYNDRFDEDPDSKVALMPYYEFPSRCPTQLVAVMNADFPAGEDDGIIGLNASSNYNTESETLGHTNKNICAPGTYIKSTYNSGDDGYTNMTGTSMASPFVAGVLALEFTANPNLTPAQAIDDLHQSATDINGEFGSGSDHYGSGWDRYTGYGLVNAYRAVTFALGNGTKRNISKASISQVPIQLLPRNGAAKPEPTVMYGYETLVRGRDYTVSYSDNTKTGSATVMISGIGEYYGSKQHSFMVVDKVPDLATDSNVEFSCYFDQTIGGKPLFGAQYSSGDNSFVLSEGVDYDATLSTIDSNGNAVMTVTGKGIFEGQTASKTVQLSPTDLSTMLSTDGTDYSDLMVEPFEDQLYTGEEIKPVPMVFYDGYRLCQGVDYKLSYQDNVKVGTAKVTLTGIGAFTGTKTLEFKIVDSIDISSSAAVTTKLARNTYMYTGDPIEPTVTVIDKRHPDKSLKCQMDGVDKPDYKVSFENNTNVGTANIVVTGIRGYTGTRRVPFTITSADISGANVAAIPSQTYTGSAITPTLTVQFNSKTLVQGTDYDVRFSNNVQPGTATVVISGKGNFTGSLSAQFTISNSNPSSITFRDVTAATPHRDDIQWMADNGISTGWLEADGSRTFRGMDTVKRQDMAAFLRREAVRMGVSDAEGWSPSDSDWNTFADVNRNTPHAEDILWLAHSGVSTGWLEANGSRTYRGMDSVKRQDMAAFLHRLATLAGRGAGVTPGSFGDVTDSTPHADDVRWLGGSGIAKGYPDGTYRGMTPVYRQDMAAFIHRLDGLE